MMRISIVVPYRGDGGVREDIWDWINKRWRTTFSWMELCVADSDPEKPFNRSQARNNAFAKATGDIIIIADADSIPGTSAILNACGHVEEFRDSWVMAHDRYMMFTEEATASIMENPSSVVIPESLPPNALIRPPFVSYAGMLVMHRSSYEKAGGYDERFREWGLEDWAFRLALDTLVSPLQRVSGTLIHLYHGPPKGEQFGEAPDDENVALYRLYENAAGNKNAMMEVINGR